MAENLSGGAEQFANNESLPMEDIQWIERQFYLLARHDNFTMGGNKMLDASAVSPANLEYYLRLPEKFDIQQLDDAIKAAKSGLEKAGEIDPETKESLLGFIETAQKFGTKHLFKEAFEFEIKQPQTIRKKLPDESKEPTVPLDKIREKFAQSESKKPKKFWSLKNIFAGRKNKALSTESDSGNEQIIEGYQVGQKIERIIDEDGTLSDWEIKDINGNEGLITIRRLSLIQNTDERGVTISQLHDLQNRENYAISDIESEIEQELRIIFPLGEKCKIKKPDGTESEMQVLGYSEEGDLLLFDPTDPDYQQNHVIDDAKVMYVGGNELEDMIQNLKGLSNSKADLERKKDIETDRSGIDNKFFDLAHNNNVSNIIGIAYRLEDIKNTLNLGNDFSKEDLLNAVEAARNGVRRAKDEQDLRNAQNVQTLLDYLHTIETFADVLMDKSADSIVEKRDKELKQPQEFKIGDTIKYPDDKGVYQEWVIGKDHRDLFIWRVDPKNLNIPIEEEVSWDELNQGAILVKAGPLEVSKDDEKPRQDTEKEKVPGKADEIRKALIAKDAEINEKIEKKGKLIRLWQIYKRNSIARITSGIATAAVGVVFPGAQEVSHIARVIVGALGGATLGEGFAISKIEKGALTKFKDCKRNEDGSINTVDLRQKLSGMERDEILEIYGQLSEIATVKGLRISAGISGDERTARQEADKKGAKALLNKFRDRFAELPVREKIAATVLISLAAIGSGMIVHGTAGFALASAINLTAGAIRSQREVNKVAYENSDILAEIQNDLARRADESISAEDDIKMITKAQASAKIKRVGLAVVSGALVGSAMELLYLKTHPSQTEAPKTHGQSGASESGQEKPLENPAGQEEAPKVAPGFRATETTPSHPGGTGMPGEEPSNGASLIPKAETPSMIYKGSDNLREEIEMAKGGFHEAIARPHGGEKLVDRIIEGLKGKGQLSVKPEEESLLRREWIAELKLNHMMNPDGSISPIHHDEIMNLNPLKESGDLIDHMHSGAATYASQLESLNASVLPTVDEKTLSGYSQEPSAGNLGENLSNQANIDALGAKAGAEHALISPTDSIDHSGHAENANGVYAASANHAPEGGTGTSNTPNTSSEAPVSIVEKPVVLGIPESLPDPSADNFNAALPLTEAQLNKLLDSKNGFVSKEVGETFMRMIKEKALTLRDFRLSDSPGHHFTDLKVNLHEQGRPEFIGHQMRRPFDINESWIKRLFGGVFGNKPTTETGIGTSGTQTIEATVPSVPTAPVPDQQAFTATVGSDGNIDVKPDVNIQK